MHTGLLGHSHTHTTEVLSAPLFCYNTEVKVKVAQSHPTLCDPRTIQTVEFSRPEYWSGSPFHSPGDLPNPEELQ